MPIRPYCLYAKVVDLDLDLDHVRDQCIVTALVREEHLNLIIDKGADRRAW